MHCFMFTEQSASVNVDRDTYQKLNLGTYLKPHTEYTDRRNSTIVGKQVEENKYKFLLKE